MKDNNYIEDRLEVLLPEIPFYGLSGSINRIEESDDCYYKVLYNGDGTINENKIPVPKKKGKNLKLVTRDYYNDLKKYLDKNESKYLEIERTKISPVLTNKQFYVLIVVTSLASVFSLPFLFSTSWIGVIFTTISLSSAYILYDIHKNDIAKREERSKFRQEYKKYQKQLVNYNATNSIKRDRTIYTEVNTVDKSNDLVIAKLKQLRKEDM